MECYAIMFYITMPLITGYIAWQAHQLNAKSAKNTAHSIERKADFDELLIMHWNIASVENYRENYYNAKIAIEGRMLQRTTLLFEQGKIGRTDSKLAIANKDDEKHLMGLAIEFEKVVTPKEQSVKDAYNMLSEEYFDKYDEDLVERIKDYKIAKIGIEALKSANNKKSVE